MLDAGHGGKDSGAIGFGVMEKDFTLRIVKAIRDELKNYDGVEVHLTREGDTYPTLDERAEMANKLKVDYFCSVHINAGGGTGYETFRQEGTKNQKTIDYQKAVTNEIMAKVIPFGVKPHGTLLKEHNLAVLRETNMPAILTESLFIDNANDIKLLKNDAFIDAVIAGHVNGFVKVLGLTKKASAKPDQPAKAPANGKTYRVIAGSFGVRSNAVAQQEKLIAKGFKNFIVEEEKGSKILFRVVSGSYGVRANADAQVTALKKAGFDSFVE